MQVFFSDQDPVSEAAALIRLLEAWMQEQPEQPLRPATANFKYGMDGSLRTINIVLGEPK